MSEKIQDLTDFFKHLSTYQARATKRLDERKSCGQLDGNFNDWVVQELLIDLINLGELVKKHDEILDPKE